jgi:hypothetical protein
MKMVLTGPRMRPSIKEALGRAARDDRRSLAAMADRILCEWLVEHGYLPKPQNWPSPSRTIEPSALASEAPVSAG